MFETVPRPSDVMDKIESVRNVFSQFYFDENKCSRGLSCLKNYRKEWDDKRQAYKTKPLHDWTSHCADAMRYCAVSAETWEQQPVQALQQTRMRLAAYVAGDSSIGY